MPASRKSPRRRPEQRPRRHPRTSTGSLCSCLSNDLPTWERELRSAARKKTCKTFREIHAGSGLGTGFLPQPSARKGVGPREVERRTKMITKKLAVLATVGAIGAATLAAPAPAEARHFGPGPGLAFGLAAGALTAGAIAASSPYYGYGPY